jgi:CRP-like cAMP-binding protein
VTDIVSYLERYQLTHVFDVSLRKAMHIQTIAQGEALCRQGDVAHELYLLVEGKLKITHMSATGKRLVLSFKHPFDLVGDIEFGQKIDLMNTVEAVTPVTVLRIAYADLEEAHVPHSAFLLFLHETITKTFELKSHTLSYNLLYPVEVRLASYLLSMPPDTDAFASKELVDAADLVGTSYRHVNRVLRQFVYDGLIRRTQHTIEIIDRDGLMERVGESIYE